MFYHSTSSDFDRTLAAMDHLRRRMDRAFDELDGRAPRFERAEAAFRDEGDKLVLVLDLPGVAQKDVALTIHQDVLSLTGERKSDAPEGYYVHREERAHPDPKSKTIKFAKSLSLPCKVDSEKTQASLKNGVLTVTLGKAPEAQPRRINVLAQ